MILKIGGKNPSVENWLPYICAVQPAHRQGWQGRGRSLRHLKLEKNRICETMYTIGSHFIYSRKIFKTLMCLSMCMCNLLECMWVWVCIIRRWEVHRNWTGRETPTWGFGPRLGERGREGTLLSPTLCAHLSSESFPRSRYWRIHTIV